MAKNQTEIRQPRIERLGATAAPVTGRYPRIIGGVCEKCGIIDPNKKSEEQYTLCQHFRNLAEVSGGVIRCSYCDEIKNPLEVIRMSDLMVAFHPDATPDNPKVLALCDTYECNRRHQARFKLNKS